jgi:hypothetical protein
VRKAVVFQIEIIKFAFMVSENVPENRVKAFICEYVAR